MTCAAPGTELFAPAGPPSFGGGGAPAPQPQPAMVGLGFFGTAAGIEFGGGSPIPSVLGGGNAAVPGFSSFVSGRSG